MPLGVCRWHARPVQMLEEESADIIICGFNLINRREQTVD